MKRIDCDVFMKAGSTLELKNKVICITGNFYASNDCFVTTAIVAGGDVILGDHVETAAISAGGNVIVGNFSDTMSITSGKNVQLGDYTYANNIFAEEDTFLGYESYAYSVTPQGDVFCANRPKLKCFFQEMLYKLIDFFSKN